MQQMTIFNKKKFFYANVCVNRLDDSGCYFQGGYELILHLLDN